MSDNNVLGVVFSDSEIFISEINHNFTTPTLIKLGKASLPYDLEVATLTDKNKIIEFSNALRTTIDELGITAKRSIASIDSSLLLIQKIQIDTNLTEEELLEHIFWEIEQITGEKAQNYTIDFETFAHKKANQQTVVFFALRRLFVNFLTEIFNSVQIPLFALDTEILSVQNILKLNYSASLTSLNLLIKAADNFKLLLFAEDKFWEIALYNPQNANLIKAIEQMLDAYRNEISTEEVKIANIFYYGKPSLKEKKLFGNTANYFNANLIEIFPSKLDATQDSSLIKEFLEPVGLALRTS
ncbi:pilus assembly protein PilM [bacterium]|nr:pilus assembly protein PilM [bacterium]